VEVDPRNIDDVKRTIHDCGVAYIGFNVHAPRGRAAGRVDGGLTQCEDSRGSCSRAARL
jgi:hypothetical protein